MSLESIYYVSQIVASFAVLASLIYLAIQTRQTAKNQQAIIRQNRATRLMDLNAGQGDPAVADTMRRGMQGDETLTPTQLYQYQRLVAALAYNLEDSFYQHQDGQLPASSFASVTNGATVLLSEPGFRVVWRAMRKAFAPEFANFMDTVLARTPVRATRDEVADWRAAIAGERQS
jgi:hypothetical protein